LLLITVGYIIHHETTVSFCRAFDHAEELFRTPEKFPSNLKRCTLFTMTTS